MRIIQNPFSLFLKKRKLFCDISEINILETRLQSHVFNCCEWMQLNLFNWPSGGVHFYLLRLLMTNVSNSSFTELFRVSISDSTSFAIFEFYRVQGHSFLYFPKREQRPFLRKASPAFQSGSDPCIIGSYGTTHFSFIARIAAVILQLFMKSWSICIGSTRPFVPWGQESHVSYSS